jgi:5-methylcytosine-specific restriction endonuclease McrA
LNYTDNEAPLLDQLAAVLDHVEAASRGGKSKIENLVTSCNKCNMNKDALLLDDWEKKRQKSKSSNCKDWDGFSSLSLRAFGRVERWRVAGFE